MVHMSRVIVMVLSGASLASVGSAAAGAAPVELAQPRLELRLGGEVGARIDAVIEHWILTTPDANPGMLEMFRLRDRNPPYENPVPWAGEFAGKYLTSAVLLRRMTDDPRVDALLRSFVPELIATQADDGYLGPFPRDQRLLGAWDLWGHYHVMLGLYLWYYDTGDRSALDAAVKAADLVCDTYLDTERRVYDADSHEMNMAIIHILGILERETGNTRYLRMMRAIMEDWERPPAGDYYREALKGADFYQTPKARWESLHPMMGMAEMYRITGEGSYRDALLHFWHSIRRTDIHNSGSFSTNEGAVGNPFKPGSIETCCTIAWLAYSTEALRLSTETAIADAMELATVNAVLGHQHPSGRWCTYSTPMDGKREASAHTIVFQSRAGTPELNCCSVNGPRGLGQISEWAVLGDASGLYLNYYGAGTIEATLKDGAVWAFTQETDFPVGGEVRIRVEPGSGAPTPVHVRIPGWSKVTIVAVNGEPVRDVAPGTYCTIARAWESGDTIALAFDMRVHALRADENIQYRTSLYRGPVLLAYDQQYNSFEHEDIPTLDLNTLSLEPCAPGGRFAPMTAFTAQGTDGRELVLVDFASAGAHGTLYRSWLPVDHAPPVAFYLRRPVDGAETSAGKVLLQWSGAGPEAEYRVQLARDEQFSDVVYTGSSRETYAIVEDIPQQDAPVYWRVMNDSAPEPIASDNGPWSFTPSRAPASSEAPMVHVGGDSVNDAAAGESFVDVEEGEGRDGAGSALVFNGTTSRVVVPVSDFPVVSYAATAWIRPRNLSGGDTKLHEVISGWCKPSNDPMRMVVSGERVFAQIEQQSGTFGTPGVPLTNDAWAHVAAVKDGEELRLYVDGVLRETASVPGVLETDSQAIGIGCNPRYTDAESFDGSIADARVYGAALSDAEILEMARAK